MKPPLILLFGVAAAIAQTGPTSIQGTILEAKTQKPISAALVIASRSGAPPFSKNTRSGLDGAFKIQDLKPGNYSLCVQTSGDQYLDPCQWNEVPVRIAVRSGQAATGISIALNTASVLNIELRDSQKAMAQRTKDGRRPELTLGVWGPNGHYYPAHAASNSGAAGALPSGNASYTYQLAIPRDTALHLHISSRDLKLGDANGIALSANANRQAFQHATNDLKPKGFVFTVLGLLPY